MHSGDIEIKLMDDDREIRRFLSTYYNDHIPHNFTVGDHGFVLGVYAPELVGCFPFVKMVDIRMNACFMPEFRGKFAVNAGKMAIQWIFDNCNTDRIHAVTGCRKTSLYASLIGMIRSNGVYEVLR